MPAIDFGAWAEGRPGAAALGRSSAELWVERAGLTVSVVAIPGLGAGRLPQRQQQGAQQGLQKCIERLIHTQPAHRDHPFFNVLSLRGRLALEG